MGSAVLHAEYSCPGHVKCAVLFSASIDHRAGSRPSILRNASLKDATSFLQAALALSSHLLLMVGVLLVIA